VRILVFQTAYLGDLVLTTPLLATLGKVFPDAHLTAVIQPSWRPVLEHSNLVDEIITFDKRGREKGIYNTLAFAKKLRKKGFDVALCPHPSFRSALILKLSAIPRRIGFDTSSGGFFFSKKVKRNESDHEIFRILSLLNALDIEKEDWITKPIVNANQALDADEILKRNKIEIDGSVVVGVHPGSVWATKRWTGENFTKVCQVLSEKGLPVIVFGTRNERSLVDAIVVAARNKNVMPLIGLTLEELIVVFQKLSIYVTNDSGPMHIAGAMDIPVVSIFGSTVPKQGYAPFGDMASIVQVDRLDCRPCGPHGRHVCPEKHFDCMKKVEPKSVLMAVSVILGVFEGTGFLRALKKQQIGI